MEYLSRIFLIFSQTCISHHGWKKYFKFMVLRLLENTFVSQRILMLPSKTIPQVFIITTPGGWDLSIYPKQCFLKICFSPAERERTMVVKIWPKLNLQGYWSQVLIYSTICNLYILVSVLLCHNLDLSMLKWEVSLT